MEVDNFLEFLYFPDILSLVTLEELKIENRISDLGWSRTAVLVLDGFDKNFHLKTLKTLELNMISYVCDSDKWDLAENYKTVILADCSIYDDPPGIIGLQFSIILTPYLESVTIYEAGVKSGFFSSKI